jgi:hypothetical protein
VGEKKVKPNPFKPRPPKVNNFLETPANQADEIEEDSSLGKSAL